MSTTMGGGWSSRISLAICSSEYSLSSGSGCVASMSVGNGVVG